MTGCLRQCPLTLAMALLCLASLTYAGDKATPALTADEQEARDFQLDWERIEKYFKALANIKMASDSSAATRAKFQAAEEVTAATFSEQVKKIETRTPEAAAAIQAAGQTTRDFVVLSTTLVGATLAVEMKKAGTINKYPPTLSPENAVFVERNFTRIQALLAPYAATDEDAGRASPSERRR